MLWTCKYAPEIFSNFYPPEHILTLLPSSFSFTHYIQPPSPLLLIPAPLLFRLQPHSLSLVQFHPVSRDFPAFLSLSFSSFPGFSTFLSTYTASQSLLILRRFLSGCGLSVERKGDFRRFPPPFLPFPQPNFMVRKKYSNGCEEKYSKVYYSDHCCTQHRLIPNKNVHYCHCKTF